MNMQNLHLQQRGNYFKWSNNYQAHRLKVMSEDGRTFKTVKQLVPARQGWQNTDFHYSCHPPVTARYFRFEWTPVGSEPGSEDLDAAKWKPNLKINDIVLHTAPRIHQWEGKTGWCGVWLLLLLRRNCPMRLVCSFRMSYQSPHLPYSGRLTARLPEGKWRILRMGHTATGHECYCRRW